MQVASIANRTYGQHSFAGPGARAISVGVVALAVGLASGCVVEQERAAYDENGYAAFDEAVPPPSNNLGGLPSNLTLGDASLRGAIGEVAVDDEAWVDGYANGQYASVYTAVDEALGGAVMTIVDVEGGLAHDELAPGVRHTYRPEQLYDLPEGAAFVTVVGCAGPEAGTWSFDQTADAVTVEVSEGATEQQRVFEYSARFDRNGAEPSVVTGRFVTSID